MYSNQGPFLTRFLAYLTKLRVFFFALNTHYWTNNAFVTLVYYYMEAIKHYCNYYIITLSTLSQATVINLFRIVNCTCVLI